MCTNKSKGCGSMKSELIENLIVAHCSGDEDKFQEAIETLAIDEEKKGNVILANKIRKAYVSKKRSKKGEGEFSTSSSAFSLQSVAPRDKDSLLELFEIITPEISFADVVLPESQKNIITQVIEEQRNAEKLLKNKMTPVNRLLLCGPPGCGKTITAYAIGHELGLPIAYVRLDGLVSSYLGQTSTNLRKVFDAVKNQRIILFLDEFDAIAKKRDDSNELGELKRVVTTLLQNFDNMPENVLLIAATNHEHLLDPAIWRRFNVTVTLELPNSDQRKSLLEKWFQEYGLSGACKLDYDVLSKISEGLNGAQIKEWAIAAGKTHFMKGTIKQEDITGILIQQLAKFSGEGEEATRVISEMNSRGISTRQIGKALGIPNTTLDYQIKKYRAKMKELNVNE